MKTIFIALALSFLSLFCPAKIGAAHPKKSQRLFCHMIYFPWDKQQRFLQDEFNFDHNPYYFIKNFAKKEQNVKVQLWTFTKAKQFCAKYYPEIWSILERYAARPTMYVDILRWLFVYHYGGVYLQYRSVPKVPLHAFLPQKGTVRFFTEKILSPEFAAQMANVPIRNGKPEELLRIRNQIFSAKKPKEKIIWKLICFLTDRMEKHRVTCDYDILYISANAAVSEFYDRYCKTDKDVELTSLKTTDKMIQIVCLGSWRVDKPT